MQKGLSEPRLDNFSYHAILRGFSLVNDIVFPSIYKCFLKPDDHFNLQNMLCKELHNRCARKLTAVYGFSCCKYTIICKRIADKFAQKIFCALRPSFSVFQTESTSDRFSNVMNCSGFARRRPKTFLYSSYFRLSVPITFAVL